jgi:hypothetical protein
MIQEKVEQENLNSSKIMPNVQFHGNNHNSQSNCSIRLDIYLEFPRILFFIGVQL